MDKICGYTNIIVNARNYDPTRTTVLRNAFASDSNKRFRELEMAIKKTIVEKDAFGLKRTQVYQMRIPNQEAFAFERSREKVVAFMKWLQEQIDRGILEVRDLEQVGVGVEAVWTNKYLFDSYKRGIMRARSEMRRIGLEIPTIVETGGILVELSLPIHIDRLGLLYTRVFSDLKGITDVMDMHKIGRAHV